MPELDLKALNQKRRSREKVRPYDIPVPDTKARGNHDELGAKTADAKTADAKTADAKTASAKTASAKTASAKTASAKTASAKTANAKTADAKTANAKTANAMLANAKKTDAQLKSFVLALELASQLTKDAVKMLSTIISAETPVLLNKDFEIAGVNKRKLHEARQILVEKDLISFHKERDGNKETTMYFLK